MCVCVCVRCAVLLLLFVVFFLVSVCACGVFFFFVGVMRGFNALAMFIFGLFVVNGEFRVFLARAHFVYMFGHVVFKM